MPAAYRQRYVTAQDGLRLYYRDYGDPSSPRLPLICLTGITRNSTDFADFAERHAGERRVLCLDYRGRGRSDYDRDWRNYQPQVYAGDIVNVIAANDLHRVVFVGTSLGGLLTMGLAVLKPTLLGAVVLNDIGPDVAPAGQARILGYIGTDQPQPDWPSAVAYLRQLMPTLAARSDEGWLKLAQGTFRPGEDGRLHFDWDVNIAKPLRRPGAVPNLWAYFGALRRVPVLALRGALSDVLSAETFERMAQTKPDLLRVTVADTGHTPSLNEADAAAAVDDFIRRF